MDNGKLKELKGLMDKELHLSEAIKESQKELDLKNKVIIETRDSHKKQIATLKAEITEEALKEFEETGVKKLAGGVGIQVKKTLSYDSDVAFEYCKQRGLFLKFDDKSFNKVATDLGVDFVTPGTKNTVTFPKEIKL
jgi:hypothetical protein